MFGKSLLLSLALAQVSFADTLGDSLWRTYSKYVALPTTAAEATQQGWYQNGACTPRLGQEWAQNKNGLPSTDKPIVLYFTPSGQVTGVGTMGYGNFTGKVVEDGYWRKVDDDQYFISVTFRDPASVCDAGFTSSDLLGDRALINADILSREIPLQQADAISEGYETGKTLQSYCHTSHACLFINYPLAPFVFLKKGSCFASMGTHSFYDLVGANGAMTWEAGNLMPVVPMYDRNNDFKLNAIFFTTPFKVQQSAFWPSANQWEPVPLVNYLMCKNFCDDNCGWDDTKVWSTMHFYFSDPKKVTCENGCSIGCCE
jgi:hypothetical protein